MIVRLIRPMLLVLILLTAWTVRASETTDRLAAGLAPLLSLVTDSPAPAGIAGSAQLVIDNKPVTIQMLLVRHDADSFDLDLAHPQYSVRIRRRGDATAFALPHHKRVFLGRGPVDAEDQLRPQGLLSRLISSDSMVATYAGWIGKLDAATAAQTLMALARIEYDAPADRWTVGRNVSFQFGSSPQLLDLVDKGQRVTLRRVAVESPKSVEDWPEYDVVALNRADLERQLVRGIRRATEVLIPAPSLTDPARQNRKVSHGELRWIDGHRVVLLQGTPDEIGAAHGELLRDEAMRCIDSVLHAFGTVQTVVTGRWFRQELDQAYARLAPHIPEDHKIETRALARSLKLDPALTEAVNVFPELFHCSGFAVFGSATMGGKLYHGRVLDYMTMIGLQDAATTFIIAPAGKIPFANVGYGGFIGSVSGMNAQAISLGEMGGRGEGKWDGVPMATLMRRALEECSTLDQVIDLWKKNPRTCEYYYVFADGKTNRAVGVAAVPESVQFVQPGEAHPLLGDGIPDAVVLSAGDRLKELRRRVTDLHGRIDAETAQGLMCRPVAMTSNLHNVLFVPADRVLYVANADHKHPAADRPYVRLDLNELLHSFATEATAVPGR